MNKGEQDMYHSDSFATMEPEEPSKDDLPKPKKRIFFLRYFGGCVIPIAVNAVIFVILFFIFRSQGILGTWPKVIGIALLVLVLAQLLAGIYFLGHQKKSWGGGLLTGGCCSLFLLFIAFFIFLYFINTFLIDFGI